MLTHIFVHILHRIIIQLLYPWYVIIVPMYNAQLICPSKIWAKSTRFKWHKTVPFPADLPAISLSQ